MNVGTLPPGARFGRYIIDRALGSGTFGVVYAARREDLQRPVALKVLHADLTRRPEVVRRFDAEAKTIAALRHPHIVDVNDVGAHQGVPFLAMELLEGETLRDRIEREGALPLDAALDLLLPVFSAVSAVHAAGIVHRDIKPENIVLAAIRPGRVHPKLLDFGVAKTVHDGPSMTRPGAQIGTPFSMSPEQVEAVCEVGAASDQWALAVLLYRCITGAFPFDGGSVVRIFHAILEDAPRPPSSHLPSCPALVERAILRALAKSPSERFPSVGAFGAVLFPFASRRSREDWSDEFVDAEARTFDLDPPRRPLTRQGPTFQALLAAAPLAMDPELYEEDIKTDVRAHQPAAMRPVEPIAPLVATVAIDPPMAAVTPRIPAVPAVAPAHHPGTLSLGASSSSVGPEEQRLRKRVVLAGVVAAASVIACVVVVFDARHRAASAGARTWVYDLRGATGRSPEREPERPVTAAPHGGVEAHVGTQTQTAGRAGVAVVPGAGAVDPDSSPAVVETLPERASRVQVGEVMRSATNSVARCAGGHRRQFTVAMAISSEGVPGAVTVGGLERDEAARRCVVGAVQALRFPRSQLGRRFVFRYRVSAGRQEMVAS